MRWDDDVLKSVFQAMCPCGGAFSMLNYHRNPHLPSDPIRRIERMLGGEGGGTTYDVLECECATCGKAESFPFAPERIHTSVQELLQSNRQWIRIRNAKMKRVVQFKKLDDFVFPLI